MLVGRDDRYKYEDSSNGSSEGGLSSNQQINAEQRKYKTTQEEGANKKPKKQKPKDDKDSDEDDDSPYFVKITLDGGFLSHLQIPDIVTSKELNGRYQDLIQNDVFRSIIQREVSMMFGLPEMSEKEIKRLAKINIEKVEEDNEEADEE